VVNLFANGKAECAKCPGLAAFSICAHTLAACLAIDRLKDFLRWLVSTKCNSGGINLSAAVAHGMPKGRGRKGERAPRKRSVGNKKPISNVVSRVALGYNSNDGLQPHCVPQRVSFIAAIIKLLPVRSDSISPKSAVCWPHCVQPM